MFVEIEQGIELRLLRQQIPEARLMLEGTIKLSLVVRQGDGETRRSPGTAVLLPGYSPTDLLALAKGVRPYPDLAAGSQPLRGLSWTRRQVGRCRRFLPMHQSTNATHQAATHSRAQAF